MEEPVHVKKLCASVDVLPTVLNLLGVTYDSRILAGHDILSDSEELVIFADHSFKTDKIGYNTKTGEVTYYVDEKTVSQSYIDDKIKEVETKLYMSDEVINTDFYGYVYGRKSTNTPSNSQHHDTPNNKTHVIKFRVTAEEKTSLELTCKLLNLSLSTFIRRAIHNVKIEKTVIVAGGGEETLTAVSTLLAQCSKVGSNLNQLARHFNSGGADTEQIRAKLLDELADLTAFRLNAEKVLGELYGNAQAYRL